MKLSRAEKLILNNQLAIMDHLQTNTAHDRWCAEAQLRHQRGYTESFLKDAGE